MSVQSEITRISNAKAAIKTALANKSVIVPDATKLDDYADYIDQIQAGGGEPSYITTETTNINLVPPYTTVVNPTSDAFSSISENITDIGTVYTFYNPDVYKMFFNTNATAYTATRSQLTCAYWIPRYLIKNQGTKYSDMRDTMHMEVHFLPSVSDATTGTTITDFGIYNNKSDVPAASNYHFESVDELLRNTERYGYTTNKITRAWNLYYNGNQVTTIDTPSIDCRRCLSRSSIESLTVDGNVAQYACYLCASLTSLTFRQATSRTIETYAFNGTAITSVNFNANSVNIGNSAFGSCSSLTEISFTGETTIGNNVFDACSSLNTIRLLNNNVSFTSIGNNAFRNVPVSGTIYAAQGADVTSLTNVSQLSGWTVEYV